MNPLHKKTKITLIITSLFFGLLFFPALIAALFVPMLFDAPGSEKNLALWITATALFTLPTICLASIIASWLSFRSKSYRNAIFLALLPLINILIFFTSSLFSYGK